MIILQVRTQERAVGPFINCIWLQIDVCFNGTLSAKTEFQAKKGHEKDTNEIEA